MRKHLFTLRVTEHWHRLPREMAESPFLEILKSWQDIVPDTQFYMGLDDLPSNLIQSVSP